MNVDEIAKVVHEVGRTLSKRYSGEIDPPWKDLSLNEKASVVDEVTQTLAKPEDIGHENPRDAVIHALIHALHTVP